MIRPVAVLVWVLLMAGCATETGPVASGAASSAADSRSAIVYRSPTCACCVAWVEYMERAGWEVTTVQTSNMAAVKAEHGVPDAAASCHTSLIGGYVVEGHVPLAAIEDLLADRPDIDGIALPGMPSGSPGMGGTLEGPLEVLSLRNGEIVAFGEY